MNKNKKNKTLSKSAIRRQREKEKRYNTILKAAETLIGQKGYHQASIEEIADLAEVSVGTVYFYFKNKEDLLVALMKDAGYLLRKFLGDTFRKTTSPSEGFRCAGLAFYEDFCVSYPGKVSILFREVVGQSAEVEAFRKYFFDKLTADIKNALTSVFDGTGRKIPDHLSLEVMAVCIVGIYDRVACHYLLWQDRSDDIKKIGQEAVSFILEGVNKIVNE